MPEKTTGNRRERRLPCPSGEAEVKYESEMTKKSREKEPARDVGAHIQWGRGHNFRQAREGNHEVQPRGGEGVTEEGCWVGSGEQEQSLLVLQEPQLLSCGLCTGGGFPEGG